MTPARRLGRPPTTRRLPCAAGGGALGSYQAGVYEALASEYLPDWAAGISIGASRALIAGNAPKNRVSQLRSFWEEITSPSSMWPSAVGGPLADGQRRLSSLTALLFGQPGFFAPRPVLDWISIPKPTSYYDTSLLKSTLERLVDFDRINAKTMRLSVGAVNVCTGRFEYFDNGEIPSAPSTNGQRRPAAGLSAG